MKSSVPEGGWKVVSHREPPFVLMKDNRIVEAVFGFLQFLHARGMSARTIRAYAYDLLSFHRFAEDQVTPPDGFEFCQVVPFILFLRKQNAAPRTINRRLEVVRSFLNHVEGGWGDRVFGQDQASFYKGVRNKALLGPLRIKGRRKSL